MYRIFVADFIYLVPKAWDSLNAPHQGAGSASAERQGSDWRAAWMPDEADTQELAWNVLWVILLS